MVLLSPIEHLWCLSSKYAVLKHNDVAISNYSTNLQNLVLLVDKLPTLFDTVILKLYVLSSNRLSIEIFFIDDVIFISDLYTVLSPSTSNV